MNDFVTINLNSTTPLVASAIHCGHQLSEDIARLMALDDAVRFREEDPYTDILTHITGNRIIAHHSRFEFDLNRPPENAIYLEPSDAWGLQVWKSRPPADLLERTRESYKAVYKSIQEGLTTLVEKFGVLVVFDLHSYNHRYSGPNAPPEDPAQNPEINIGTGTMNREYWAPVVDRFMDDLTNYDFGGRQLDVRGNIKFKGGYFPKWIHENFTDSVCCISIEVKKIFMDEWTGIPDQDILGSIGDALRAALPGVLDEISKRKLKNQASRLNR